MKRYMDEVVGVAVRLHHADRGVSLMRIPIGGVTVPLAGGRPAAPARLIGVLWHGQAGILASFGNFFCRGHGIGEQQIGNEEKERRKLKVGWEPWAIVVLRALRASCVAVSPGAPPHSGAPAYL